MLACARRIADTAPRMVVSRRFSSTALWLTAACVLAVACQGPYRPAPESSMVLARPAALLAPYADATVALHERSGRALVGVLQEADAKIRETVASLRALSPQATLDRGFAVVQDEKGAVVRDPAKVTAGAPLRLRLARGDLAARAVSK